MGDLVPRRIGPYELREVVRRRRTSTTYRARGAGGVVALTVIKVGDHAAYRDTLVAEAAAVASLRHSHIQPIIDFGSDVGYVFLVEEFVESRPTLADRAPDPMEPTRAVGLVASVLSALGHAHDHGVIHHDVAPGHIVLASPVWPLLTDFGLGRDPGNAGPAAADRMVIGNPAYLAPEQAFGLPSDHTTDLYSSTVVLYELLTGSLPFDAETPEALVRAHAYETPRPPRRLRPELPPDLEAVILKGLAKRPQDRYAAAADLSAALTGAVRTARPEPVAEPQASVGVTDGGEGQMASDYASGVRAFAEQRWQDAVDVLTRVADADPTYEDVTDLLRAATAARDSAG